MNYELALSFIFQALSFAELAVHMSHVDLFAEVCVFRQPDELFYYAHVDFYINLSEVFYIKLLDYISGEVISWKLDQ